MLYLGSGNGLMIVTTSNNTVTNNSSAPGTVLAVSPDSSTVLIADGTTLFIYSSTTSGVASRAIAAGASAAAWSPDGNRAYIATPSGIFVYTPATSTMTQLSIGSVASVDFLAQGSFAYLAGGPSPVSVLATCNNGVVSGSITTPPTATPTLIRSVPNATHVLAVDTSSIDDISVTEPDTPVRIGFTLPLPAPCTPPTVTNANLNHSFGMGTFTPTQLLVTPDSSMAFVLASGNPNLLVYNVSGQTTKAINLGGTALTKGGVTPDSAYVFVGVTGTNTIHKIGVASGTDAITPIQVSFEPDLVAVQP
jgi:hypothetical protein